MSVIAFVARTNDGFLLSCNGKVDRGVMRQARTLFQNHLLMPKQVSLESADQVYHYQKGNLISVMLVTPLAYSVVEAYGRLTQIHDDYLVMFPESKINRTSSVLKSGNNELQLYVDTPFDTNGAIEFGEAPPRQHISTILEQIKGQPFGFSTKVLKKKRAVVLDWKEICLLVPLTLIAFIKTLLAFRIGGALLVGTNIISTGVSFFLVFICVHDLLTTTRLIVSSFALLILTYGTTMESLTSVVFNGIFALLTLANVAHYYLKPVSKKEQV